MTATTARARAPEPAVKLPRSIRACLFDLDGVLTDTATVHAEAWKETFDAFLRQWAQQTGEAFVPLDLVRDYRCSIDGKPRSDGVRSFLSSRGIVLPEGSHDDRPGDNTVAGLANRKHELFLALFHLRGVQAFTGSIRFVHAAQRTGLRCAVVSASADCLDVLEAAGIADLFEVRVDALVAERERLRAKPAPDMFLAAALMLGARPAEAAVFEDALAGVAAGRSGRFGLVVGVDRAGQAEALRANGADIVVSDLAELLEP